MDNLADSDDVPYLIRSRNYLDLDNQTSDEQRRLNLSVYLEEDEDNIESQGYLQASLQHQEINHAHVENHQIQYDEPNVEPEPGPAQEHVQDPNGEVNGDTELADECRLNILRDLLRIERQRNEQRRKNNLVMQQYVKQLQSDYLKLQQDQLETLQLSHRMKAQKEAQLESLGETVKEKDCLIEQLREKLDSLDESRLRQEFKELMVKQNQLAEAERQQLQQQIQTVEQQLVCERVNNSQLLQQFQTKLDDQVKTNKIEVDRWCSKANNLELELERLLSEPQNLLIRSLREEKAKLECQIEESNLLIDDNRLKFDSLRKRLESLLSEQELIETRNQEEVEHLQQQYANLRTIHNELKLEIENKEEVAQILQFNLHRSEKRVNSLLNTLKGKEAAYKELIEQLQVQQEKLIDKSNNSLRSLERKLIEFQSEVDKKQNDIVRLQLEHENQLESIRNDRDQRIVHLDQEKQKAERASQAAEIKLASMIEDRDLRLKQVEQLQKELQHFREETKRLSIELTRSEAKMFGKQQEMNQLMKERKISEEEIEKRRSIDLELEETKRLTQRLEETIDELRNDNEKLSVMLKMNESHLATLDASIKKEHVRMVHEYEKKMEQIRLEQSAYDRNKIRYKKYGYKLKKYCDHLRRVHEHLCSPTICGYTITQ